MTTAEDLYFSILAMTEKERQAVSSQSLLQSFIELNPSDWLIYLWVTLCPDHAARLKPLIKRKLWQTQLDLFIERNKI